MKTIEKKIQILLKVKLEVLEEKCVRKMFTDVYENLIINEEYEIASKIREQEKRYNNLLKKNKGLIDKKKLRKFIL